MSSYFVIGGDERMTYLSSLLQKQHDVMTACMEDVNNQSLMDDWLILDTIKKSDNIILPIPYSKDSIHIYAPNSSVKFRFGDVFNRLRDTQTVFYGNPAKPDTIETEARKVNFLEDEKYTFVNARLTAEVLLGLLLSKYHFSPYKKNILICGFGRIAKLLSKMLQALSGRITIAARKDSDINLAIALGLNAVNIADIAKHFSSFHCIINTVPSCVISASELQALKEDAILIDISSKPFGVNFEAAKSLKKDVFVEQGLPGKYLPALEAEALSKLIAAY